MVQILPERFFETLGKVHFTHDLENYGDQIPKPPMSVLYIIVVIVTSTLPPIKGFHYFPSQLYTHD